MTAGPEAAIDRPGLGVTRPGKPRGYGKELARIVPDQAGRARDAAPGRTARPQGRDRLVKRVKSDRAHPATRGSIRDNGAGRREGPTNLGITRPGKAPDSSQELARRVPDQAGWDRDAAPGRTARPSGRDHETPRPATQPRSHRLKSQGEMKHRGTEAPRSEGNKGDGILVRVALGHCPPVPLFLSASASLGFNPSHPPPGIGGPRVLACLRSRGAPPS